MFTMLFEIWRNREKPERFLLILLFVDELGQAWSYKIINSLQEYNNVLDGFNGYSPPNGGVAGIVWIYGSTTWRPCAVPIGSHQCCMCSNPPGASQPRISSLEDASYCKGGACQLHPSVTTY